MSSTQVTISSFRPDVFASAMLEPPSGHKKKRMMQSVVSIVVHTGVLALLVILPLLVTNTVSLRQLDRTLLVAPPPPAPPPPRAMVVRAQMEAPKFNTAAAKIAVPTVIPKTVAMTAAPEVGVAPAVQSDGGVFGGLGSVLGGEGTAAPPPPAVAAPAKQQPILISGDMKRPVLIFAPTLLYPPIAKAARVSGTVVILAVIDEHGNVVEAHAESGPSLLLDAALQSVAKRRYQPTILDGQPTTVKLRVEVNFHLST